MRLHAALFGLGICAALAAAPAHAQSDPFYKGKRLTLLINFAAGGPADIEGRLFAGISAGTSTAIPTSSCRTATAPAVSSAPTISASSGPRDGTMAGYLTAAAWNYVIDPAPIASISRPMSSSPSSR